MDSDGRRDRRWFPRCCRPPHFGVLLLFLCVLFPTRTFAQRATSATAPLGTITGRVIDAATGDPLPLAGVFLEVLAEGALSAEGSDTDPLRPLRSVLTDSAGSYRFTNLRPGRYHVQVQHPGYRSAQVSVDLAGEGRATLTMALDFYPVPLAAVEVVGSVAQPYTRGEAVGAESMGVRAAVVRARQDRYLSSDVRSLTAGDVSEAITLAESDLFRALQRVPGVGRRDDYTAVLWTRGAPWVQTRIYFDGLPLFNPTHGGWLFSSINPDGVGSADFQPGVRSAAWGEGAAAILDLQSRQGSRSEVPHISGELSLASARLAADGELPGEIRWMLAARRTHVDLLTGAWDALHPGTESRVPYDFADFTGRVDVPLFAGLTLQASGIAESDRLRGDIPKVTEGNRARWGNRAGRITLEAPLGPVRLRATVGATRFDTDVEEIETGDEPSTTATIPALENSIEHDRASLVLEPSAPGARLSWGIGFEAIEERLHYHGPFSFTGEGIPGLPRDNRIEFRLTGANRYDAWWGELRTRPLAWLDAQGGVRLEFGDSLRNAGERRVAPRFSLRISPTRDLHLSTGWGRSYQYTQAIGASAGPLGPQLHLGNLWIIAGTGYPALRADIATLGLEQWFGSDWLLGINSYIRGATGVAEADPTPGQIGISASHVEAINVARGAELSLRRVGGRWTGALGYAYGKSELRAEGFRYPSSADVRHTLDLTTAYQLDPRLRLGAAFSYASGVPFTRIVVTNPPRLEEPHGQRTPAYAGLDLMLDYRTEWRNWGVGGYLQIVNVLGRRNAVTYSGSRELCGGEPADRSQRPCEDPTMHDDFQAGLPLLPLLGLRIDF